MAYENVDDVLAWMVMNNVNNFYLFQSGKEESKLNNNCLLSCVDENETADCKRDKLRQVIESYGYGEYVIKQADGNSKNAFCKLRISSKRAEQQAQQQAPQQISGLQTPGDMVSRTELNAMLEKQRAEFETQRMNDKLNKLEEELRQAKKEVAESGGALNTFLTKVTPFIEPVLSGLLAKRMPQPAMIGQLDTPTELEQPQEHDIDVTEEEFTIIVQSINEWKKQDPDYLKILQALPKFVTNPMYNTAKNFILQ